MEVSIFSWQKQRKYKGRPLQLPYGVHREDIERFVAENGVVNEWLRKYPESTRRIYAYDLCRYFKWLGMVKDENLTPRELLNQHLDLSSSKDVVERRKHLSWALEFTRDNPDFVEYSDKRKFQIFCAIRSFYAYHELTLTHSKGVFGKVKRKYKPKQITLSDAKRLMGNLNQRDRTILLIMLQSGMSIGDVLDHFNYMWNEIEPQLNRGFMRVEMPPRKNSDMPYFTFIGRDAVHELKKWLIKRQKITGKPIQPGEPVFITKLGKALKTVNFVGMFNKKLKKLGLKKKPYSIRSHMWRSLFKTEAGIPARGADRDYVEFMMGHSNNPLAAVGGTYDRAPEIHGEVVEGEYRKIEPFLNIYSHPEMAQTRGPKEEAFYDELGSLLRNHPEKWEKFKKFIKEL